MLTDSKVREAGFIRNSSSKKIIYHPEANPRNSDSDDDSFSSFEYEPTPKPQQTPLQKPKVNTHDSKHSKSHEKPNQIVDKTSKPRTPQIPKPTKKVQPSFQNEKLKNNFFKQVPKQKSKEKPVAYPVQRFNFKTKNEQFFEQEMEQVKNICSRIEDMKVLQGNFSFNPKVNNFTKTMGLNEDEKCYIENSSLLNKIKSDVQVQKQNKYFNDNQKKFQYDIDSQSEGQQEGQYESQSSIRSSQNLNQESHSEAMNYYKEQQLKKTIPQSTKNQSENVPSHTGQIYSQGKLKQQKTKKTTQQQNDQQLITNYNKTEFGPKTAQQISKNKHLSENRHTQNYPQQIQAPGMIQTHGGISFEVDVKQFSQPASSINLNYQTKKTGSARKKKKVNQKQQILKRRQMAKIYSKQARFRLFGFS